MHSHPPSRERARGDRYEAPPRAAPRCSLHFHELDRRIDNTPKFTSPAIQSLRLKSLSLCVTQHAQPGTRLLIEDRLGLLGAPADAHSRCGRLVHRPMIDMLGASRTRRRCWAGYSPSTLEVRRRRTCSIRPWTWTRGPRHQGQACPLVARRCTPRARRLDHTHQRQRAPGRQGNPGLARH
jgi:hypothetical protein